MSIPSSAKSVGSRSELKTSVMLHWLRLLSLGMIYMAKNLMVQVMSRGTFI